MLNQGTEGLEQFQKSLLDFDALLTSIVRSEEKIDSSDACKILVAISNFKTQLSLIYEEFAKFTLELMDGSELVILPSGETVEKKWSKDRKGWQHKDLALAVAERIRSISVDMDTGERVLTSEEMITKLLDYVQPSYWRVTALSDIGINADDYCQAGDSKPSISIRKVKK